MLERLSSKTTNEAFPELDSLIYWVVEREAMRRRREAGEEPPFSTDEILGKYRFCNVNVQDDRVSRAIFDAFTKPYADHPGLLVALTVCRFTNEPEVIEAVRDCLVPFDAERFMVIMADRAARRLPLERRAYRIPGGVKDELKAESLCSARWLRKSNPSGQNPAIHASRCSSVCVGFRISIKASSPPKSFAT